MLYNLNPTTWGSHYWKAMHYLTIAYPDEPTDIDKTNVKQFFTSVGKILPCEKCRVHFAQHLQKYPLSDIVLSSRYNLINWLKDIHNEVNLEFNKKIWTYDDVIDEYGDQTDKHSCGLEIATICLLVLIVIIILIYIKFLR